MESAVASTDTDRNFTDTDKDGCVTLANCDAPEVQVIVKAAQDELRRLIRRRVEIARRIGTVKQTIAGLCHLIGDDELGDELRAMRCSTPRRREKELQP
jgi:hypothetical protein